MCFQQAAKKIKKVVDDATGHTQRRQAASDANARRRARQAQIGLVGKRSDNSSLSRMARARSRRARGFRRTVFTSLLGDSSFGKNIKSALKLGQTN